MKRLSIIYFCFLIFSFCNFVYASSNIDSAKLVMQMNNTVSLNNIDITLLENSVIYLTNQYRQLKGKQQLVYNKKLHDAAYLHSSQMAAHNFFDHINRYEKQFKDINSRVAYVGYVDCQTLSENILYGYINVNNVGTYKDLATYIVKSFIDSKEHKENLLATDIAEIGCSIVFEKSIKDIYWYFYFTQDFGKRF